MAGSIGGLARRNSLLSTGVMPGPRLLEAPASLEGDLVLRVAEPRLHRRVVPAVALPRHRLGDAHQGEGRAVGPRRVVAALVAVQEHLGGEPLDLREAPDGPQYEREVDRFRELPGDDLVGRGVLHGREEAELPPAVADVGDVGEEVEPRPRDRELAVQLVGEDGARHDGLGDPPERVGLPERAGKPELPHEADDLLPVHRGAEEARHHHGDRPAPLRVAAVVVDGLHEREVPEVGHVPGARPPGLPPDVGMVARRGDLELPAHLGDRRAGALA